MFPNQAEILLQPNESSAGHWMTFPELWSQEVWLSSELGTLAIRRVKWSMRTVEGVWRPLMDKLALTSYKASVYHTDDSGLWRLSILRYCALFTGLIVTLMDGGLECPLKICIPCSRYSRYGFSTSVAIKLWRHVKQSTLGMHRSRVELVSTVELSCPLNICVTRSVENIFYWSFTCHVHNSWERK
jgi:hypothetical protein